MRKIGTIVAVAAAVAVAVAGCGTAVAPQAAPQAATGPQSTSSPDVTTSTTAAIAAGQAGLPYIGRYECSEGADGSKSATVEFPTAADGTDPAKIQQVEVAFVDQTGSEAGVRQLAPGPVRNIGEPIPADNGGDVGFAMGKPGTGAPVGTYTHGPFTCQIVGMSAVGGSTLVPYSGPVIQSIAPRSQ
jgi:hypothetical protein